MIQPLAENAAQLYEQLRLNQCDIAFVTLFFLKMERQQLTRVLRPINVDSPRLGNYRFLLPGLQKIPMGMRDNARSIFPGAAAPTASISMAIGLERPISLTPSPPCGSRAGPASTRSTPPRSGITSACR